MGQTLTVLMIVGLVILTLVLKWNQVRMEQRALERGIDFDRGHPVLAALLVSMLFAATGIVAALYAVHMLQTQSVVLLLPAVVGGIGIGGSGATIWAYAFARGFDVSVRLGRVLQVLTIAAMLGVVGAFAPNPFLQALSLCTVATRLVPQSIFVLIQAREDVRHPETRSLRTMRAMTMASGRKDAKD